MPTHPFLCDATSTTQKLSFLIFSPCHPLQSFWKSNKVAGKGACHLLFLAGGVSLHDDTYPIEQFLRTQRSFGRDSLDATCVLVYCLCFKLVVGASPCSFTFSTHALVDPKDILVAPTDHRSYLDSMIQHSSKRIKCYI